VLLIPESMSFFTLLTSVGVSWPTSYFAFTHSPMSSLKHILAHKNTDILIYARTCITHILSAAGCQGSSERQHCHCVVLYYTWNPESHAFLILVIFTGPPCVGVYSVSETVMALIYISHLHTALLRTYNGKTLIQKITR